MSQEEIVVTYEDLDKQKSTIIKRGHRTSITEDANEGLETTCKQSLVPVKKKTFKENLVDFSNSLYNSEYREFLSKDAMGWFKLTSYYSVFYLWLSFFFVSLLFFFWVVRIRGNALPIYYNTESVMHYKKINPGMGFRPQTSPEEDLVYVNVSNPAENIKSYQHFLEQYRVKKEATFENGKGEHVSFNVEDIIKDSPCSEQNNFGMGTKSPCVAVKLNRIAGWLPQEVVVADLPDDKKSDIEELEANNGDEKFIYVSCTGKDGTDRDQIKQVEYYSGLSNKKIGGINFKYFPYMNQKNYLSPLVFVHFKEVSTNTLITVLCKAYAGNIDNTDNQNQRGMIKFQLYVEDLSNKVQEEVKHQETTVV